MFSLAGKRCVNWNEVQACTVTDSLVLSTGKLRQVVKLSRSAEPRCGAAWTALHRGYSQQVHRGECV